MQYRLFTRAGAFNPNLEEPLPGQMKKQLVLKIISGQQLPKPKASMLGDRGEVGQDQVLRLRSTQRFSQKRIVSAVNPCKSTLMLFSCVCQIIDPFVEVEIIGLPVDCCKEQTRVVDDNGELLERLLNFEGIK